MIGKNNFKKLTTAFTLAAVWCVYSMVAYAMPAGTAAEITVSGQVTVNGQTAVSNSTIVSGSTIVTGPASSATINLGKTGRIELQADTTLTLTFSDGTIVGTVSAGKVRVADAAGVSTTMATKNATFIADSSQANNFALEVECSHVHVDTTSGMVTMREGTVDKQVAAGSSAVAGNLEQAGCKPCLRPGSAPPTAIAGWPWLLVVAGGVAGAAIFFGSRNGDTEIGGGTVIVSPTA
ncbi:MAG: hypothetical protein R2682_13035 [Pyrinomonadaceae bacterium]